MKLTSIILILIFIAAFVIGYISVAQMANAAIGTAGIVVVTIMFFLVGLVLIGACVIALQPAFDVTEIK